jgi:hypothetical protein
MSNPASKEDVEKAISPVLKELNEIKNLGEERKSPGHLRKERSAILWFPLIAVFFILLISWQFFGFVFPTPIPASASENELIIRSVTALGIMAGATIISVAALKRDW